MADAVYVDSETGGVFYLAYDVALVRASIRADNTFDAREAQAEERVARDEFERAHFSEIRASLLDELGLASEAAEERRRAAKIRRDGGWPDHLYREATPPVSQLNVHRLAIARAGPTQLPSGQ